MAVRAAASLSKALGTVGLLLAAVAGRADAQRMLPELVRPPSASLGALSPLDGNSAPSPPRWVPRPVRVGMIVGGIVGGGVAAVWWFTRDCEEGWGCILVPAMAPLPIGLGALAGIMVGGTVGRVIAGPSPDRREPVLLDATGKPRFTMGLALRF